MRTTTPWIPGLALLASLTLVSPRVAQADEGAGDVRRQIEEAKRTLADLEARLAELAARQQAIQSARAQAEAARRRALEAEHGAAAAREAAGELRGRVLRADGAPGEAVIVVRPSPGAAAAPSAPPALPIPPMPPVPPMPPAPPAPPGAGAPPAPPAPTGREAIWALLGRLAGLATSDGEVERIFREALPGVMVLRSDGGDVVVGVQEGDEAGTAEVRAKRVEVRAEPTDGEGRFVVTTREGAPHRFAVEVARSLRGGTSSDRAAALRHAAHILAESGRPELARAVEEVAQSLTPPPAPPPPAASAPAGSPAAPHVRLFRAHGEGNAVESLRAEVAELREALRELRESLRAEGRAR